MKTKITLCFIALLCIIGGTLIAYAKTLPVYTDEDAPSKLSRELQQLPREERFSEWYSQLSTFETPHKRLSDFGRGLLATGLGLTSVMAWFHFYGRMPWLRKKWIVFAVWIGVWGIKIPLTWWYYIVRQNRFDFPVWGDSTAIPIFQETFAWILGAIASSILLMLLSIRHQLPNSLGFHKPSSALEWLRVAFLALWFLATLFCIHSAVIDGDEGMAFSSPLFASILYLFLISNKLNKAKEPTSDNASDPVDAQSEAALF